MVHKQILWPQYQSHINLAGATTAYVNAGGKTHGTTGELYQYLGNRAYDNYRRTESNDLNNTMIHQRELQIQ